MYDEELYFLAAKEAARYKWVHDPVVTLHRSAKGAVYLITDSHNIHSAEGHTAQAALDAWTAVLAKDAVRKPQDEPAF
ncbi:hypothetical protein [Hymenobacter koreensis]|uniref:Uncharacterized protein n=1 Tax=Hymenobacter koreensis TaxID=1084523 RepID=A0ABP8JKI7_9BACT